MRIRSALPCSVVVPFALLCCGEPRGELREWQPSDHQPPAAAETTGQGQGSEGPADPTRAAAALWGMRCASCHGEAGRGDGAGKPPGAQIPDFTTAAFQDERDNKRLAEVIFKGQGLMPAFGKEITPEGIAALVSHIRTLRAE